MCVSILLLFQVKNRDVLRIIKIIEILHLMPSNDIVFVNNFVKYLIKMFLNVGNTCIYGRIKEGFSRGGGIGPLSKLRGHIQF